jgi:uncharacterized integral membrane protein
VLRYLKWVVLAVLAVGLVTVALANRAPVTLKALPPDLAAFLGIDWTIELPLFLVIFGGLAGGVLLGFVWEWLREMKHRSLASTKIREVSRLERELAALREAKGQVQDEVLALIDRRKAS